MAASLPRFSGDLTLEMIDDFLSPIGKPLSKIQYLPPSATGGLGFLDKNDNDDDDEYYVPFSMRHRNDGEINTNYALQYQRELEDLNKNDDLKSAYGGVNSIVGSGMSQIESVTTFETPSIFKSMRPSFRQNNLNDIKEITDSINSLNMTNYDEEDLHVYETYNIKDNPGRYDTRLKITPFRSEITNLIAAYPVCIIQGGTGCGKTTQVPQYILDAHAKENQYCNIIITQPRRIAAISVASRVCNERGWTLGTICGYQIGLDRKYVSKDTRICYVTTGVLLQKLINKDDVSRYTHIFIDEVHERDLDVDFTLLVLKLLMKNNANIKVILMSATIDCDKFSKYFSSNTLGKMRDAPVFDIEGQTYQVQDYYLDDLYEFGFNKNFSTDKLPEFNYDDPKLMDECLNMVIELLKHFDEEEKRQILNNPKPNNRIISEFAEFRGSVLIFVPGMRQIQQLEDLIRLKIPNGNLNILPLHSDIVIDQQKLVFEAQRSTRRKVILSTSIAESSITVPDIKYVIDFCLTKELWCDSLTNYTHLRMEWASISSLNQRKGRAGRVSDGACYRLISRRFLSSLDDQTMPQILRVPLPKLILNVKRLKIKNKDPKRLLAFALQPPNLDDIDRTILILKEAGALTLYPNAQDGDLTYVGNIMASLPLDIKYTKLILLGHAFGKLRECIIIAAALSTKTFFIRFFKSHLEAFKAKWYWSQGTFCDCLTILNAYNLWEDYLAKGKFKEKHNLEAWAKSNMIDLYRIREVRELKMELERRLAEHKIVCNKNANERKNFYERNYNRNSVTSNDYDIDDENDVERHNLIIKIIIAGAFYPNYYQSSIINEYDAFKTLSGKDIKQTVMIKGLPMHQGILYHNKLHDMFKFCSKFIQLHYEDTKAFIEFKSSYEEVKTNINFGVYLAVQMRLLRIPLTLPRLNDKTTIKLMDNLRKARQMERQDALVLQKNSNLKEENIVYKYSNNYNSDDDADNNESDDTLSAVSSEMQRSRMSLFSTANQLNANTLTPTKNKIVEYLGNPEVLIQKLRTFSLVITEIIECGHFWAQINETDYKQTLTEIQYKINQRQYKLNSIASVNLYVGMLVLTQYCDEANETFLYRAKILHIDHDKQLAEVHFVDYGNKELKRFNQLYHLIEDMHSFPFQAIECKLAKIKINKLKCPNGVWSNAANNHFLKLVHDKQLNAHVYSFVDNVVRIELKAKDNETKNNVCINDLIIKAGYAEAAEESQISKKNYNLIYDKNYEVSIKKSMIMNVESSLNSRNVKKNDLFCRLNDSLVSLDLLRDDEIYLDNNNNNRKLIDDESKYDGSFRIAGPYSPLEVSYHPITFNSKVKAARVERDSINFATLDDDPQNEFERMLTAAEVTLNHQANGMILRGTTLMPKIRGLTSILCLLFTPQCELRLSPDKKSYTGALCGLGYDKVTKLPLYVDDDIECVFDIKIGFEDITLINTVRMAINMVIGSETDAQNWTSEPSQLRHLQQLACTRLLSLIERERLPIEKRYIERERHWNLLKEEDYADAEVYKTEKYENLLYKSHAAALLKDIDD